MLKLSKEKTAELSMELISIAGDSAGLNLVAIQKAKKGDFKTAQTLMQQSSEQLLNVHKVHAEILQNEAAGIEPEINTLFVHAQDHFANALIFNDLTKYFVDLYQEIDQLKKEFLIHGD